MVVGCQWTASDLDDWMPHLIGVVRRAESTIRWLFPGARAARPMESVSLSRRLKVLGSRPRPTRNASLVDLAAELPGFVFSRLLGFSGPPRPGGRRGAVTTPATPLTEHPARPAPARPGRCRSGAAHAIARCPRPDVF
ncbi:hypothetical protein [Streptomyces melanogenes]|uniref:hypothetical protein n=1 Tax=Streptomyces melanogenes TaxID=67326 RepID=UPI00167DB6FB|nr:hypothetical protein [Streptomyces melanogenes]